MIISKTPYRISFFGGGSDYPSWYNKYSGAVLSTSINKHLYITCRILPKFFEHKFRIVWSKIENVQRNLGQEEASLKVKERECREINENVNKLRDEKQKLTEHLRIIIYENEKKKQEKLRELMLALGLGDVTEEEAQKAWKGFNV